MRVRIHLECTVCKNKNYSSTKNKTKTPSRMEIKKFCRHCQKHTLHKETK